MDVGSGNCASYIVSRARQIEHIAADPLSNERDILKCYDEIREIYHSCAENTDVSHSYAHVLYSVGSVRSWVTPSSAEDVLCKFSHLYQACNDIPLARWYATFSYNIVMIGSEVSNFPYFREVVKIAYDSLESLCSIHKESIHIWGVRAGACSNYVNTLLSGNATPESILRDRSDAYACFFRLVREHQQNWPYLGDEAKDFLVGAGYNLIIGSISTDFNVVEEVFKAVYDQFQIYFGTERTRVALAKIMTMMIYHYADSNSSANAREMLRLLECLIAAHPKEASLQTWLKKASLRISRMGGI